MLSSVNIVEAITLSQQLTRAVPLVQTMLVKARLVAAIFDNVGRLSTYTDQY